MRIPPICEPASRRQTQFISPPKFHSHLLEWNGFQRWPHRAPQPARGCFPIRQHRSSPPPPQSKAGVWGRRQSVVRGAGRQPSPASEPTLNFKRLIRKRRPFPSLRAAKYEGAGISSGLCGGGNEVTVTAPAARRRGRRAADASVCAHACERGPTYLHVASRPCTDLAKPGIRLWADHPLLPHHTGHQRPSCNPAPGPFTDTSGSFSTEHPPRPLPVLCLKYIHLGICPLHF